MYYYSKKSKKKIIHTIECFHILNTDLNDIGYFETLPEAYKKGYRLCKHCSPLTKQYKKESREIIDFCIKNGLSVRLGSKSISVESSRSEWKITVDKVKQLVLYHKNEFVTSRDHLSEIQGYHLQKDVLKDSVVEYLDYIVGHDYYRMLNPLCMPKNKQDSPPPRKGSKRYKSAQRRLERYERRKAIKRVLDLIDSLNIQPSEATAMAG